MSINVLRADRGRVAILTVSDPARRNALSFELSDRLVRAVAACEGDESVHAMVITGAPPAFCAGADLDALTTAGQSGAEADLHRIYAGFLAVANTALPTIAAVNGPAVGAGLNLALACDLRLVGPGAWFDARFLRLGIHPGGGMTWLAQRAAGAQTAAAIALFGEPLDAAAAVRTGLAYRSIEVAGDPHSPAAHEAVVAAAVDLASRAANAPRDLVIATKAALRATAKMSRHADALTYELAPQLATLRSLDD